MQPINILKDLSFDSSLLAIDTIVNDVEYKEKLISLLQSILEKRFPNNIGKQTIRPYHDRISFACPICGDSMKNNYKKRGSFILKGKFINFFKCHNCGEFKRIDHFFNDFKINVDLDIINYISQNIENFSKYTESKYDMSMFMDTKSIDNYAIDRQEFLKRFALIEVKESPVWPWLKNRLQYDDNKFMYHPKENYLVILNLTQSGKILGVQKRLFKGANKYLTYKLSKLYELIKKDPKSVSNEIDVISQIFNICLINFSKPITLFEGPLDSFLFKNSISNTGIHKKFPIELPIRIFFDYDKDGISKTIEKINEGYEVFLWEKFLKDIHAPKQPKWDWNDILIWAKKNNIKITNIDSYFSNDPLDIIDI